MRILAVVALTLASLLAGCTQGTPGDGTDPGFAASCPSWIKYPHNGQIIEGALQWTNMSTNPSDLERWDFMKWNETRGGQGLGDGHLLTYGGHPLDQVWFDFNLREKSAGTPRRILYVEDAELHARFYAAEAGYPGQALEPWDVQRGPSSAQHEWVFRTDPAKGFGLHNITLRIDLAAPDQDPAPVGVFVQWELIPDLDRDRDTPSLGLMHYAPEFWYRTASKVDGQCIAV